MKTSIFVAVPASSPHVDRALPLLIAFAAGVAAIALGATVGADALEQSRLAARWTARVSFLVFLIVYCAPAATQLFPSPVTKAVLRRRRQWGLAFALAHGIHLAALTHYMLLSGEGRPVPVWILTGTAYALTFALALTSNDASQRLLRRWWKRLHRTGIHYIWFIFLLSYASRIPDPARMHIGLVFVPIVLAALGLRLAARMSTRRARSAARAASPSTSSANGRIANT